jgi:putative spermidine/putrescine transport system substrate-binding protein
MTSDKRTINRRSVLKFGAATAAGFFAAPGVLRRAYAARELNIAFTAGHEAAARAAFLDDFEKDTGTKINFITRRTSPVTEVTMQVQTRAYQWDIVATIGRDVYLQMADYVEPLDYSQPELASLPENVKAPGYAPYEIVATLMSYKADLFAGKTLAWEDLLNTTGAPGGRTLRKRVVECVEIALRMSGVDHHDIQKTLESPGGWDMAFKKLDEIRPVIDIWWTEQLPVSQIVSGEIVIAPGANSDLRRLNNQGGNMALNWDRGFYKPQGFVVLKGAPNADIAKELIRYALKPERIGKYTGAMGPGPLIPGALDFVDPAIVPTMPTFPANLAKMAPEISAYWSANADEAATRFNEWLLKG